MKPYQIFLAIVFVCVFVGLQTPMGSPYYHPAGVEPDSAPMFVADIAAFETALVWSNNTGSQIVEIIIDNFDLDPRDEVAVITQNGTLVIFDDNREKIAKVLISSEPFAMSAMAADAGAAMELLVGTADGFLVIAADQTVLTNISLPNAVRVVSGADIDGDTFDEAVVGCDDWRVYAYEITGVQSWFFPTNAPVRLLDSANVDGVLGDEVLAASTNKRFSLIDGAGSATFENNPASGIEAIAIGDVDGTALLEVFYGTSSGKLSVFTNTGTSVFNTTVADSISALRVGNLVTGGKSEIILGTSGSELRVLNETGGLLWNKTLGAEVSD
ncbi:MAG: hypothetical protein ACW97A_02170, partial [Candidatus Thorarchaeota archaeon]